MYTLKRSDGLIKRSEDVRWIEFNEDGRGKELHETPAVGLSLIMHPFNIFSEHSNSSVICVVCQVKKYVKWVHN